MSEGTGSINVDIESLGTARDTIKSKLEEIEGYLTSARAAGVLALVAVGGQGTKVGSALNTNIREVNIEEFKKTKASIESILQGITNATKTYEEEEESILSAIKSFNSTGGN